MGETWATMLETLNFAIELDVDLFQLSISTPYPGTALYKEAKEAGTLRECSWYEFGQGKVLVAQPQITDDEIYRFERYAFRKFYLRPIVAMRMLRRLTRWRQIRDLFVTATILLLGRHKKNDSRNWESWKGLDEEDYLDLPIPEPDSVPLTYQLRQGAA